MITDLSTKRIAYLSAVTMTNISQTFYYKTAAKVNWHRPYKYGTKLRHCHSVYRPKEIRVPPKIRVLPSGTLSQTLDIENFASASRSCRQQNSWTVELVKHTYDCRRVVAGRT